MSKMQLNGKTALITGAASGIGRAIAISLAQRCCNLALTDIDEQGLDKTHQLLSHYGVHCTTHYLDVSDAEAIENFPRVIQAAHKTLDILVNNAGVALGGMFEQVSAEEFEWLFNINFWGVVRMTRAFLPLLRQSADARLVNISSVYGLAGIPGQVAYCSSKFGVRGFSEALRIELTDSNIGVTVVHPGGVATAIADKARVAQAVRLSPQEQVEQQALIKKLLTLDPAIAGEIIVKGIENRQNRILVGDDAKMLALIVRLFPVSYWNMLSRLFPVTK
jgi:NAD(P)-dependent dehydrogenase (short-subunit alcohol dehydrogenase family)